jgi:hypothetical protein
MTAFDAAERVVTGPLGAVRLDRSQATVLRTLLTLPGYVVHRQVLVRAIHGYAPSSIEYALRCLNTRVWGVRKALRDVGSEWRIETASGRGWALHLGADAGDPMTANVARARPGRPASGLLHRAGAGQPGTAGGAVAACVGGTQGAGSRLIRARAETAA